MSPIGLAVILSETSHPAPFGHPEQFGRLALLPTALGLPEIQALTEPLMVRRYGHDLLKRVHTSEYVDRLCNYHDSETGYVDPDTFQGPDSFEASCDVTWALLSAVDDSFGSGPKVSFILGRPPGHHASADRGMGFCLINHAAVAAQYALDIHKCRRVAVIDFDIHHGNGTQQVFYERSDVLYISTHQSPFYPGTGTAGEQGAGEGLGYTANFPFWAGAGNTELVEVFQKEIVGILDRYEPEIIIVSAGFDGHYLDPLGGFKMTGEGFRRIGLCLREMADRLCGSRLVSVLEGGYDPQANVDSITNYLKGTALV
jgi:acetoin utilization deacetylase AcuC-like enzyme